MKGLTAYALALAAAATVLAAVAGGASAASKATYYVSVGDSLAQGYQPIGGPDSALGVTGYNQGYADQLFRAVRGDYEQLQLVKLGCGGESTFTMVAGAPWCGFPLGSQLAEAEAFLREHAGEVEFITVDIGANDFLELGAGAVPQIITYLPQILTRLRAAAGAGVPIIGMNYYNPFLPEIWFTAHSIAAVQASAAEIAGLNGLLETIYAAAGAPVADVESAFGMTDSTLVDGIPLNVLRECELTWMCSPQHGPDIHANTDGYAAIAAAFQHVLP